MQLAITRAKWSKKIKTEKDKNVQKVAQGLIYFEM